MKFILIAAGIFFGLFIIRGKKLFLDTFNQCQVENLTYFSDASDDIFQIDVALFKKRKNSLKKTLLLLPPTGGKNIIDEGYAYMFCKKGYDVYILEKWTGERAGKDYTLDFNVHQRYMDRTQRAISLILKNIEADKIDVLGTSAGAINYSLALANESTQLRTRAFFNIVGGAPLCHIIAQAGEEGLEEVREARFKEFGFKSMEEYQEKICSVVTGKIPMKISSSVKFGNLIATKDKTVPTDLQKNLIKTWNPQKTIEINADHFGAILRAYIFKRKKILDFFTR